MTIKLRWPAWRHVRSCETFTSGFRITLALFGVMAVCLSLGQPQAIIPSLLGVIASALAETDDNWRARLGAQLTTLCCFALIIVAVRSSLSNPVALMLVLVAAAFILTLLGALGERYRAMATATLIMSLYTAIAIQPHASRALALEVEILLLSGAAWYGLISVAWAAAFPMLPVEQNLAQLFSALGKSLELKSRMFEPVRGIDLEQRRLALALHNGRVVELLNTVKENLYSRMSAKDMQPWLRAELQQFFVAQDVHERASSSHENYALLASAFFHSDVLYRCERVLAQAGEDCQALAAAIRKQDPWPANEATARAVEDMDAAVVYLESSSAPVDEDERRARRSIRALASNLGALAAGLSGSLRNDAEQMPVDTTLRDTRPKTVDQFRKQLAAHLNLKSPIMRHAIRLSLALMVGYALMMITADSYGFWIPLTIVFVCQPRYAATLTRLIQRIWGTLLGLLIGWALLKLFQDELAQSFFTVAAGVLFFMLRSSRYTLATAAITTLVLLAFNQVGNGYDLIVPRLLDTLAGSLIAGMAVWLVLPSWYSRRLHRLAADALRAQALYLREIMLQYGQAGKHDHLAYRIARREAHNADAALSTALTAATKEPAHVQRNVAAGTHFLVLSHTLLNYLSALGAHRSGQLEQGDDTIAAAVCLEKEIETLAKALDSREQLGAAEFQDESGVLRTLVTPVDDEPEFHRILRAQLSLALRLLPALRSTAGDLVIKRAGNAT
ncbi:MAG: YccS family putative transporter [Betaproteobacteria bacterium]